MKERLGDPMYAEVSLKLERLEIKGILFDLDDTLIYTAEMFYRYMEEFSVRVSLKTGLPKEEVSIALQEINDDEYKTMGVNPQRWEVVVKKLAGRIGRDEEETVSELGILMSIYSTKPRLRRGVRSMLQIFREIGVRVGLVTHANVEWTNYKLDRLGLWDFFDEVVIADENGHKRSEDWKKGMDGLGVSPKNCLVVGDSLRGDICLGDELGARTIYMPSPWSVYRQGEVPEKTVVIGEIDELFAALDRL